MILGAPLATGTNKKAFRHAIHQARQHSWDDKVSELEAAAPKMQPELHRHIRRFLHPLHGVTRVLKVGDSVIAGDAALDLLARHFEAQSSLAGPRTAEQLIKIGTQLNSVVPPQVSDCLPEQEDA